MARLVLQPVFFWLVRFGASRPFLCEDRLNLFKKLLIAPAALGLLAPMAASAVSLNLDGVNTYASEEQITSISQFSDGKPTDWAYQALSNLIERYGCVAGYPDGSYKGGLASTPPTASLSCSPMPVRQWPMR